LPPKSGGSKWRKVPFQADGTPASTTDRATWSTLDRCRAVYDRGGYDGVGFVFDGAVGGDGLCFVGVDFDKCVLTAPGTKSQTSSIARARIKGLGTYSEASPSGTGFHCIARAAPLASGVSYDGVEVYSTGRYFTFTGHSRGKITSAPEAVRLLVEEVQAAKSLAEGKRSSASQLSAPSLKFEDEGVGCAHSRPSTTNKNDDLSAGVDTGGWFEKLPPAAALDVLKHALNVVAKSTKYFECERYGGDNLMYHNIALAVARSGVPGAGDLWVKQALQARDADPEDALRAGFERFAGTPLRSDGKNVTVGTLLSLARDGGADFSPWKLLAAGGLPGTATPPNVTTVGNFTVAGGGSSPPNPPRGSLPPDVVYYVPGREDECRQAIDKVLAADERVFTLEGSGTLCILRVPDLPDDGDEGRRTRWDGDLPGTSLAVAADVNERAEKLSWMMRAGGKSQNHYTRQHPPRLFIQDYLPQMRGRHSARPLRGIARVPYCEDDGTIRFVSGYDPETRLYHDKTPFFDVPQSVSRDDAIKAAKLLSMPFSEFKFENQAEGEARVLGAIFTAIERPFLDKAPLIAVRGPMSGTGKGLCVRGIVQLGYDTEPVFSHWGETKEEFEKRLGALLLKSPGALCIDNANGKTIQGDLVESIITEGRGDIRILGCSEMVRVQNNSLLLLTGNNFQITGDMARRTLVIDIQPHSANPESDCFKIEPVKFIQRKRPQLLRAAYAAMRAYRLAGMPSNGLPAVGSFDVWSRKVRDLVYWLTAVDLADAFRRNRDEDPRRQDDAALLAALHDVFNGVTHFNSSGVVDRYTQVAELKRCKGTAVGLGSAANALHDALDSVFGNRGGVSAKSFGYWARRMKGAHTGGFVLEAQLDPHTKVQSFWVRRT